MKKTIKGITYDIYQAAESHCFTNDDESVEYTLYLFHDGCALVGEWHYQKPSWVGRALPRATRTVLRRLTRQQAMELIVENLIPPLLRPDFRELLARPAATTPARKARRR